MKKIFYPIISLVAVLGLAGCTDWLEQESLTKVSAPPVLNPWITWRTRIGPSLPFLPIGDASIDKHLYRVEKDKT